MFVDDTNFFYSQKNKKTFSQIVSSESKLVNERFLPNKLSLDSKKKKIRSCNIETKKENSAKFLGVIIEKT